MTSFFAPSMKVLKFADRACAVTIALSCLHVDDAIADSPLVSRKGRTIALLAVAYRF